MREEGTIDLDDIHALVNHVEKEEANASILKDLLVLRPLYAAFKPRCWWWEVVEVTRVLLLTAVLSIISSDSVLQVL